MFCSPRCNRHCPTSINNWLPNPDSLCLSSMARSNTITLWPIFANVIAATATGLLLFLLLVTADQSMEKLSPAASALDINSRSVSLSSTSWYSLCTKGVQVGSFSWKWVILYVINQHCGMENSWKQNLGCHILHRSKFTCAWVSLSKGLAMEGGMLYSNSNNMEKPEMYQRF